MTNESGHEQKVVLMYISLKTTSILHNTNNYYILFKPNQSQEIADVKETFFFK